MSARTGNVRTSAATVARAARAGGRLRAASAVRGTTFAAPADVYRLPLWAAAKLVYRFAPISLYFRLATLHGRLDWWRDPTRTATNRTIEHHLGCPEPAARSVAQRYFEFRRRAQLGRLWPQIHDFRGADAVVLEGLHHLDEALAAGKGAILVSAHFGHARLIKPLLVSSGRPVVLVGRLLPRGHELSQAATIVHDRILSLPRWSRFSKRCHETVGPDVLASLNVRPLVEALRRNQALVILVDGRRASNLRRLSVLGMDVYLAPGAIRIAKATGAPVLPVFAVDDLRADPPGYLRLEVHAPLDLDCAGSALDTPLQQFATILEQQIRLRPQNWYWSAVQDGVFVPALARY